MAEGTPSSLPSERQTDHQSDRHRGDEAPRGERPSGPREGGFRIRLSDNEMRSARALQEAFGLRSTVAVLGFALRTLGQQLEEGKLDDLVAQHKAQMGSRGPGPGGRTEGRRDRSEGRGSGGRWQEGRGSGGKAQRVDPFARPSRPALTAEPTEEPPVLEEGGGSDAPVVEPTGAEAMESSMGEAVVAASQEAEQMADVSSSTSETAEA